MTFSKQSLKDAQQLKKANLWRQANALLTVLRKNPFQTPPKYEKLTGDMKGLYSRRINQKHRLLYEVDKENSSLYIVRMWSHYE